MAKAKPVVDYNNLYDQFSTAIEESLNVVDDSLNIIDFIEQEVELGIDLTPQQVTVLKAFYNVPLTETEESILEAWGVIGKTTWNSTERYQSLILESGRRCISADTLISTDKGLVSILDLSGKNLEDGEVLDNLDFSVKVPGKGYKTPDDVYKLGLVETKTVTTDFGYEITGTPEHKLLVLGTNGKHAWKTIDSLSKGDLLCIDRSSYSFEQDYLDIKEFHFDLNRKDKKGGINLPDYLKEDYGYFIGTLVGDGTWGEEGSIHLTSGKDDIDFFESRWHSIFPKSWIYRKVEARNENVNYLKVYSKSYRKMLHDLGYRYDLTRGTKDIPWSIKKSPKSVQAAFLSGLFDTGGSVEKNGASITFSTSSKKLANSTQVVLLSFGIICNLSIKIIKKVPYYMIAITGDSSRKIFQSEINFSLPRKKEAIDKYVSRTPLKNRTSRIDLIPFQKSIVSKTILELPKSKYKNQTSPFSEFSKIVGNSFMDGRDKPNLFRKAVLELVESDLFNLLSSELKNHYQELKDTYFYYSPVSTVKKSKAVCYDFEVPIDHRYVANGICSSNSGKTTLSALITAYEFYLLCKLGNAQTYYGIATSTPISILVLATTATQAKKTIFKTVTGVVNNTKYFKRLIDQGKIFVGKEEISYEDKLLYIYSGNSQSGSQVGGTMKTLVMDEVARFKDSDGESNALELWSNLGIATTTFGKEARRIAISSAWYEGDAISQLYESTKVDASGLGIQTASWDLNPIHASRDNPIVASEYARDPDQAALEFEGVRPSAVDAFLNSDEVIAAFTGKTCLTYSEYTEVEGGFPLQKLKIQSCESRSGSSTAHLDPAIKKDSYALALGHNEFDKDNRQIVVIDALMAWAPTPGVQVSMTDVQKNLLEIHKYRTIDKVSADHYNSAETIQRLRIQGIKCETQQYSNKLQRDIYSLVRMLLHEGRLVLPNDSPLSDKLRKELRQIQLIKGQKIDHPKNGSKDLSDCVASVCWNLASRIQRDQLNRGVFSSASFSDRTAPASGDALQVGGSMYTNLGSPAKQQVMNNLRARDRFMSGKRRAF